MAASATARRRERRGTGDLREMSGQSFALCSLGHGDGRHPGFSETCSTSGDFRDRPVVGPASTTAKGTQMRREATPTRSGRRLSVAVVTAIAVVAGAVALGGAAGIREGSLNARYAFAQNAPRQPEVRQERPVPGRRPRQGHARPHDRCREGRERGVRRAGARAPRPHAHHGAGHAAPPGPPAGPLRDGQRLLLARRRPRSTSSRPTWAHYLLYTSTGPVRDRRRRAQADDPSAATVWAATKTGSPVHLHQRRQPR